MRAAGGSGGAWPGRWVGWMLGVVVGAGVQLQEAALAPGAAYGACLALGCLTGFVTQVWNARWAGRQMDAHARGGRWAARAAVAGWLLCGALLAFGSTGLRASLYAAQALPAALEGQDLLLDGRVASLPRRGERGWSFEVDVQRAEGRSGPVEAPPRVRLSWSGTDAAPQVGDGWRWTVRLQRPHGWSNPGGFDAELWLWEQGLHATGYVRQARGLAEPVRLRATWHHPIEQSRQHLRDALLADVAHPRAAGVLAALLAGDQAAIDPDDWEVFRRTGVAHLVSVSGLHVTMFAWLAVAVVGWAWRVVGGRWPTLLLSYPATHAAQVGGVALAALYAAFAGWGVPSQRTVWMLGTVVLLRLLGRRWPWPVVWLAAMCSVVALDPWALLQPGFWLSFVAVGVLFASSPQAGAPSRGWRAQWHEMVRTQAVVTVALAPLTLLLFGQFSLVGLVANLFAVPWVTLVVTPLVMAGAVVPGAWMLGGWAAQGLLLALGWMADWPLAAIERPALPLGLAVLAAAGGVLLVLRLPWGYRAWGLCLLWPALAFSPARPQPGQVQVLAADVGQGTAVLVRTARHTLVYDTGPPLGSQNDAARRVLLPLLRAGGDTLHAVVISHNDGDHASGAAALHQAHPGAQWWSSFQTAEAGGGRSEPCVAGVGWVWDGVRFDFLHPRPEDLGRLSDNASSCVLRVAAQDSVVLLTGDITLAEETRLALAQPYLRATLLFAGHHGSHTSSGPVWLNTVRPQQVIIQAAYRSRYGHPAPVVLQRLKERRIPWVNTASCGAAEWRSEAPGQLLCHRTQHRRYWHHPGGP